MTERDLVILTRRVAGTEHHLGVFDTVEDAKSHAQRVPGKPELVWQDEYDVNSPVLCWAVDPESGERFLTQELPVISLR